MTVSIITILFVLGVVGHITYVECRTRKKQRYCNHKWHHQEIDRKPRFMRGYKYKPVKIYCPNCGKRDEISHYYYRNKVLRGEVTVLPKK